MAEQEKRLNVLIPESTHTRLRVRMAIMGINLKDTVACLLEQQLDALDVEMVGNGKQSGE